MQPRIHHVDIVYDRAKPLRPFGRRAADQQPPFETARYALEALKAVVERAVVKKHLRPDPRGAIAAHGPEVAVE